MEKQSIFRRLGSKLSNIIQPTIYSKSMNSNLSQNEEHHQPSQDADAYKNSGAQLQTIPSCNEVVSIADFDQDPCYSCADPCFDHKGYPSYLKIDYKSPLEGSVKPYVKHVLISTGKSDWGSRIEDECGTLASNLNKVIKGDSEKKFLQKEKKKDFSKKDKRNKVEAGGLNNNDDINIELEKPRIVVTNSDRQNSDYDPSFSKGNDILLFPDNILIRNVSPKDSSEFYKKFLSSSMDAPSLDEKGLSISSFNFTVEPMPYKAVIVICSHKRRDKRCGITGPILKDEFNKVLKEKGLDVESNNNDGVAVFLSSHTGGHRFAGNVIVYRGGQGIWYGRVIACHAKNIVETTVLEGKVIKDLYRGSMNGSFAPGRGGRLDW
ncbi:sucrase/ferredoxin-like family protein [Gigaspora margarita]|uniref:Sucrase/ferredoxin-like family protein n=1 Tax=Gigaspora margarita TaxID=4874 RepID=A0A8H3X5I1_GIGMA|nr:sucrase/ferredoxin-like family protein [Gigaspora margarita]